MSIVFVLTACEHAHEHVHEHDHDYGDVPQEYADLQNPYRGDLSVSVEGRAMYVSLCAECHGDDAAGDGPRALSLDPPPADLLALVDDPDATDGYVFWRIAEGDDDSAMPAWAGRLDEADTWAVITHLQCQVEECRAWNGSEVVR